MTYDEFLTIDAEHPGLSDALAALALDRGGRWDAAHERCNTTQSADTNRVHAYLHRKEGDLKNAGYWYDRVRESMPAGAPADEWTELVRRFLG